MAFTIHSSVVRAPSARIVLIQPSKALRKTFHNPGDDIQTMVWWLEDWTCLCHTRTRTKLRHVVHQRRQKPKLGN